MSQYTSLQLFAYAAAVLWALGFLILGAWAANLSFKMENNRLPNKSASRERKFAFQRNPSDYCEAGQIYRCKAIKVELALFAWFILIPSLVGIVSGGK